MIRGSEDTAERYKQDIFKYAKQKYGVSLTIRGLNHLKALF